MASNTLVIETTNFHPNGNPMGGVLNRASEHTGSGTGTGTGAGTGTGTGAGTGTGTGTK